MHSFVATRLETKKKTYITQEKRTQKKTKTKMKRKTKTNPVKEETERKVLERVEDLVR